MFDETKDIWIKIYKTIVIILFFICIIGGFVISLVLSKNASGKDVPLIFLIGITIGVISAFSILPLNMLILNYLRNVQIIRQKEEAISSEQTAIIKVLNEIRKTLPSTGSVQSKPPVPPKSHESHEPPKSPKSDDVIWACSCGKLNKGGTHCVYCGKSRPAQSEPLKHVSLSCSKCGWKAESESKAPNFCPQCGNQINECENIKQGKLQKKSTCRACGWSATDTSLDACPLCGGRLFNKYACSCGWKPVTGEKMPNFCPKCGASLTSDTSEHSAQSACEHSPASESDSSDGGNNESSLDCAWICSCGKKNECGKFCAYCGKPRPHEKTNTNSSIWICTCGTVNQKDDSFCFECGRPKPKQ